PGSLRLEQIADQAQVALLKVTRCLLSLGESCDNPLVAWKAIVNPATITMMNAGRVRVCIACCSRHLRCRRRPPSRRRQLDPVVRRRASRLWTSPDGQTLLRLYTRVVYLQKVAGARQVCIAVD